MTFPTAIAFVPQPGTAASDPLYFVTELHGSIKVVTNDGTVETFASDFAPFVPVTPLPINRGENGTAGICLDPGTGSVFVTYVYNDSDGVLRNGMSRFRTRPVTFGTRAESRTSFDSLFAGDRSAESHQIGPCQVVDGSVFVAVGDGMQGIISQSPRSTLGKILRMTLDGRPQPDNPFNRSGATDAEPYVWAMGLRNVFSLVVVGDRVFGAENGRNVDRFLELEAGNNYQWTDRDWTISMNSPMVFAPAVSPVQLDYADADYAAFPPEYRSRFYLGLAGGSGVRGPGLTGERSVVEIDYDFDTRRLRSAPEPIVRYRGEAIGTLVAVGLGPDGLYFAPLFPGEDGSSPVLRLSYDPDRPHAHVIGRALEPAALLADEGCLGCHQFRERGGNFGPSLDDPPLLDRLTARLGNPTYLDTLASVDRLDIEPFTAYSDERRELAAAAPADRPRLWLRARLLEPRFDDPGAAMPNVGLTEAQAEILADFLLAPGEAGSAPARPRPLRQRFSLPRARYRHVLGAFLIGLALPILLMLVVRVRRRRTASTSRH